MLLSHAPFKHKRENVFICQAIEKNGVASRPAFTCLYFAPLTIIIRNGLKLCVTSIFSARNREDTKIVLVWIILGSDYSKSVKELLWLL